MLAEGMESERRKDDSGNQDDDREGGDGPWRERFGERTLHVVGEGDSPHPHFGYELTSSS